jgi:hypothetical protein
MRLPRDRRRPGETERPSGRHWLGHRHLVPARSRTPRIRPDRPSPGFGIERAAWKTWASLPSRRTVSSRSDPGCEPASRRRPRNGRWLLPAPRRWVSGGSGRVACGARSVYVGQHGPTTPLERRSRWTRCLSIGASMGREFKPIVQERACPRFRSWSTHVNDQCGIDRLVVPNLRTLVNPPTQIGNSAGQPGRGRPGQNAGGPPFEHL